MKYVLSLLAAVLFLGCDNSTSSNGPAGGSIMPLKVGNYWHYKTTRYDRFGTVTEIQEGYMRVTGDTLIGSEKWYGIYTDSATNIVYAADRADGEYMLTDISGSLEPRLSIPYPAAVGKTLVYRDAIPFIGEVVDSLYLKATNVMVTTPAGTFSCYHYVRYTIIWDVPDKSNLYYAPGVGLIRAGAEINQTVKTDEIVLQDFHLQ